jgi:hypothetical protein
MQRPSNNPRQSETNLGGTLINVSRDSTQVTTSQDNPARAYERAPFHGMARRFLVRTQRAGRPEFERMYAKFSSESHDKLDLHTEGVWPNAHCVMPSTG